MKERFLPWKTRARQHPAWALLCLLELLLLLYGLAGLARPPVERQFGPGDFAGPYDGAFTLETDADGIGLAPGQTEALAAACESRGDGLGVPVLSAALGDALPVGLYEVSVTYRSGAAGQGPETALCLEAKDAQTLGDSIPLPAGGGSVRERMWYLRPGTDPALVVYFGSNAVKVSQIGIREVWSWRLMRWLAGLLLLTVLDIFALWVVPGTRFTRPRGQRLALLCLAGGVFVAGLPALGKFISYGFDLEFHLSRISGIAEGLRAGQFPVRIYPDSLNGYGYASPIFYGDMFLYFPAALYLLGCPLFMAYNVYVLAVHAACFGVCWFCLRRIFGDRICAAVGAFLYTAAPYRLYNVYWRPALGEVSAQTFLPLIVYGFWALYAGDVPPAARRRAWLPLMLGFTGVIQTHVITTEIAAVLALVIVLCCWRKALRPQQLRTLLKGAGATVLLNLWFLVPFLTLMARGGYRCTQTDTLYHVGKFSPDFTALFAFTSGHGYDIHLGLALLLGAALFTVCCVWWQDLPRGTVRLGAFALAGTAATIWLGSLYRWDNLEALFGHTLAHYLCAIQFPFRVFTVTTLLLCLCTACALALVRHKAGKRAAAACGAALMVLGAVGAVLDDQPYLYAAYGTNKSGRGSQVTSDETTSGLEYLPLEFDIAQLDNPSITADDGIQLTEVSRQGLGFTVTARNTAAQARAVDLPLTFYPGYRLTEGQAAGAGIAASGSGRVRVVLPAGFNGRFAVAWRTPLRWRLADMASLCFALALVGTAIWRRRQRRVGAAGE